MPTSNDRKISQLPESLALLDDTNFLVINGMGTAPRNERIDATMLFHQIPVEISVGADLNGKDVIFNSTPGGTNRFVYDGYSGDLALGHDLTVANNTIIEGDLVVKGVSSFSNPVLLNLSLPGVLDVTGAADFKDNLNVDGTASFNHITGIGNFVMQGVATFQSVTNFTSNANFTGISTGYISAVSSQATNMTAVNITAGDLNLSDDLSVGQNATIQGMLTTTGNVFGDTSVFNKGTIATDFMVGETLTSKDVVVANNLTTPAFTTQNFTSQFVNATNVLTTPQLNATTATLSNLTTTNLTATSVQVVNQAQIPTLNATVVNSGSAAITGTATIADVQAGDITTSGMISGPDIDVTRAKMNQAIFDIYTTPPPVSSFGLGTMIIQSAGGKIKILVAVLDPSNNKVWADVNL